MIDLIKALFIKSELTWEFLTGEIMLEKSAEKFYFKKYNKNQNRVVQESFYKSLSVPHINFNISRECHNVNNL